MSAARTQRVGLVSCGRQKARSACPARDLYVSDYFRSMREYVEATCDDWRILSGLHGLVHPQERLEPYEQSLSDLSSKAQSEWARKVVAQLRAQFPQPDGIIFEIHAGAAYSREVVPLLKAAGYQVVDPLRGEPIGRRLQWYRLHIPKGAPSRSTLPRVPSPEVSMTSEYPNYLKVTEGSRVLHEHLQRFLQRELEARLGAGWWTEAVVPCLALPGRHVTPTTGAADPMAELDLAACLIVMDRQWGRVFQTILPREARSYVNELVAMRNRWAHATRGDMSRDDAWRALDTMARLLGHIEPESARRLRDLASATRQGQPSEPKPTGLIDVSVSTSPPASPRTSATQGSLTTPGRRRVTAADFENELWALLQAAQATGAPHVDARAGDLHRRVGAQQRMPMACSAMRKFMRDGDEVLQSPPSGQGASLVIRYRLPR